MDQLRLQLVQFDIIWEEKEQNFQKIEHLLKGTPESDLIILPEMFSTGFSIANVGKVAESMNNTTVNWLKKLAKQQQAAVTGSFICQEDGNFYNRMTFVYPEGHTEHYDKRHLFGLGRETELYSAGKQLKTVEYKGWKINLQVCYDLRFPVWNRNNEEEPFDLQLYVASWPDKRIDAWNKLLMARAIENQCYVAAVNRVGMDDNGLNYNGCTQIIDPTGIPMDFAEDKEIVMQIFIDKKILKETRDHLPFLKDMDHFQIKF